MQTAKPAAASSGSAHRQYVKDEHRREDHGPEDHGAEDHGAQACGAEDHVAGRHVADSDLADRDVTDDCHSPAFGAAEVSIHAAEFANRIPRFQVSRLGGNGKFRRGNVDGDFRHWAVRDD